MEPVTAEQLRKLSPKKTVDTRYDELLAFAYSHVIDSARSGEVDCMIGLCLLPTERHADAIQEIHELFPGVTITKELDYYVCVSWE